MALGAAPRRRRTLPRSLPKRSAAATLQEYFDELSPDRRAVVAAVRGLVNAYMPKGYREGVAWGMLGWAVPLERDPDTSAERRAALQGAYAAAGKKLDMGKSCLRFKKLDDLLVGQDGAPLCPRPQRRHVLGHRD